jgi:adenylate cyclase
VHEHASDITAWIVDAALEGLTEHAILSGLCDRLNAAGFGLVRASIANDLLDPTFDARGVLWVRGRGGFEESFARSNDGSVSENWATSPFRLLLESGGHMLRRRLDATYRRGEFPILDRLQKEGATDYVAFISRVGQSLRVGDSEGIVASWTTDAPDGFRAAQVELLDRILPTLTLVITMWTSHRNARTLLTTYLGSHAAERVLAGNIVRGRAEPIRSVVWFSDLTGFTRISDTSSGEEVLALLNQYAEAQVEEIEAHGGHVLKFIGDGILAIFPHDDARIACRSALDAAAGQRRRIATLNAERSQRGLAVSNTHVALHVGEVLYGNLGSARRLDFTVLGPAVNEAARIEALCGSLDQPIVVSSAFAEAAGEERHRLISLGRYAMKGVARPQHMYTLDLEAADGAAAP